MDVSSRKKKKKLNETPIQAQEVPKASGLQITVQKGSLATKTYTAKQPVFENATSTTHLSPGISRRKLTSEPVKILGRASDQFAKTNSPFGKSMAEADLLTRMDQVTWH